MADSFADKLVAACASGAKRVQPAFANPNDRNRISGWLRQNLLTARRFYLDDDVTRASVALGVQHPDILLQMLRRGRTPFSKVWIEWPVRPQLDEAGIETAEDAPDHVGVLIEALDTVRPVYRLTEIGMTTDGSNEVTVNPFSAVYNLEDPRDIPVRASDFDLLRKATGLDAELMRNFFVGSGWIGKLGPDLTALDKAESEFRRAQCAALTEHVAYAMTPVVGDIYRDVLTGRYRFGQIDDQVTAYDHARPSVGRTLQNLLRESSGTWRIVISMLALLNAHDFVAADELGRAGKSRFVGGKIVPYLSHHIVKLKLPRRVVQERMLRILAEAIPRRRHEVMGHWAESRKRGVPDCDHAYVQETPTRESCAFCGKKRWWVREHERGTAEIGYVTKDRLVTRS